MTRSVAVPTTQRTTVDGGHGERLGGAASQQRLADAVGVRASPRRNCADRPRRPRPRLQQGVRVARQPNHSAPPDFMARAPDRMRLGPNVLGGKGWSTFRLCTPNAMHPIRGRSVCTARPDPRTPSCWRWPPNSARRSPSAGWTLVWGGGNVSAMGALATAARARGGWTVGVIPKTLVRREVADKDADELIVTDTMRSANRSWRTAPTRSSRCRAASARSRSCSRPGPAGYLGMHDKPVVMLDPGGHFDGLRAWLRGLLDSGYVSQAAMDRLVVVDDVDAAIAACTPR